MLILRYVMSRSAPPKGTFRGRALRDTPKDGCQGDYARRGLRTLVTVTTTSPPQFSTITTTTMKITMDYVCTGFFATRLLLIPNLFVNKGSMKNPTHTAFIYKSEQPSLSAETNIILMGLDNFHNLLFSLWNKTPEFVIRAIHSSRIL